MQLFIELIQVSIGNRDMLSRVPTEEEWNALFEAARRQAIAGIAFMGISRYVEIAHKKLISVKGLEVSVDDEEFDESWLEAVNLPEELYYTWMQQAMDIQKRNRLMDERCVELQKMLSDAGFRSCILKGQGVARLYKSQSHEKFEGFESKDKHEDTLTTNPSTLTNYRQSGDIDVWIEGNIHNTVKRLEDSGIILEHISIKHAKAKFFDDAEVEVHFIPTWFYNPCINHKFQNWLSATTPKQFAQSSNIEEIHSPTIDFNLVYLLIHAYKHLFDEGIGLRQVMDYFFVLMHEEEVRVDWLEVRETIKELGLEKFASALLWVINEVFIGHSPNQTTLTPNLNIEPNEKEGRFLLNEIMRGGNFGKYDSRNNHDANEGIIARNWRKIKRSWRFISYYPQEVAWMPFWKLWHWGWRKWYGYM